MGERSTRSPGTGTLGTFAGVFTPSVLTILGIILFLRLGYVVGNAGLANALLIVGLANVISVLTSISLSAVATNLKVKGGGDYYLISRTLGVEFGGAIGCVLFMAQSVSVAFYCMGFGEALAAIFPAGFFLNPQMIAAIAIAFLFIFAWLGSDWATRFQYLVMAALVAALASFFWGGLQKWNSAQLTANWSAPVGSLGFWAAFAIFFPAVTGFTQGVSMSGDLRDPGRSLPLGTFLAVSVSIVVYFGATFVFAATLPLSELISDYGAMNRVAAVNLLVDVGVVAATLSSAMASYLGAPRILQSMAKDRLLPFLHVFAEGHGPTDNPRRGVLCSTVIAFAVVGLGNLNLVAHIVSMFFLISYGLLNYSTYFEAHSESPSFRPRFKFFDKRLCLLGALCCLGSMLALDVWAGISAMAILLAIYNYLKRSAGPARWADSRRSFHLQQVRQHLYEVANSEEHPRNWRPQILAFSNDPDRRGTLLRFAVWLEGGSGMTTLVQVIEATGVRGLKEKKEAEQRLKKEIEASGLEVFPLVVTAPSLERGIETLVQAAGLGPIRPNIVLLNWVEEQPRSPREPDQPVRFGRNLQATYRLGLNLLILDAGEQTLRSKEKGETEKRGIDIWWQDNDATGHLILLLGHLLTRNENWQDTRLRILQVGGQDKGEKQSELEALLVDSRIDAEVVQVSNAEARVQASQHKDIIFLPFRLIRGRVQDVNGQPIDLLLDRLSASVAMVLAAKDIDLGAEPEEGLAAEHAALLDKFEESRKKAVRFEEEEKRGQERAEELFKQFHQAILARAKADEIGRLESAWREAREQAAKESRRAAKAAAKVEMEEHRLEELGLLKKNEPGTNTSP